MMRGNPYFHPMCGLHAANVVVSEYNKNGECPCLNCNPCTMHCQQCSHYKDLLKEADEKDQIRLERCIACMKQR